MNYLLLLSVVLAFCEADNYLVERETFFDKGFAAVSTTENAVKYLRSILTDMHHQTVPGLSNLMNNQAKFSCAACDAFISAVMNLRKEFPDFLLRQVVLNACVDLQIQDRRVCDGILRPDMDILFYIIDHGKNVTADKMCNLLLAPTCHNQFDYFNWTINIPEKPKNIPQKVVGKGGRNLRILHVTDIHYDPRYTPGAGAFCGEPLCCQNDQGTPSNPDEACGFWGDYRASDIPKRTVDEALRHMRTQEVDYVYFTGDIICHRVWSTSKENNSNLEREIMELLRNNFDVPVFFVLGNHEPHPMNSYAPLEITEQKFSTEWLFELLSDELKDLVPNGEITINEGGFYTLILKPGFRVIVLNNNICYTDNFWLNYDDYDVYGQLEWLIQVLEQAEQNGEYVHILQHIPTGNIQCLGTWGREFTRIVNRFSDTISGQFNGHTHLDEFQLYFNESESTEAIHVAFNGASLTTFTDNNPSYKIYDIDAETFAVVNVEEWTFNLTAANLQPEKPSVDWYKLYSFKEAYGLSSLEPKELGEMVLEMASNCTLLEMYNRYRYRMGNGANNLCDDNCHKSNLCTIVTSSLADTQHCEEIKKVYDENNDR